MSSSALSRLLCAAEWNNIHVSHDLADYLFSDEDGLRVLSTQISVIYSLFLNSCLYKQFPETSLSTRRHMELTLACRGRWCGANLFIKNKFIKKDIIQIK